MPLSLEKNPQELFHPAHTTPELNDIKGPLCVVYAKSNREKALANQLAKHNIPYFLPMLTTRNANRQLTFRPLFGGILFAAACTPSSLAAKAAARAETSPPITRLEATQLTTEQLEATIHVQTYPHCPFLDAESQINDSRHTFKILRPIQQERLRKELSLLALTPAKQRRESTEHHLLTKGQKVRFVQGTPMEGMEGIVETLRTNAKHVFVTVNFSFLGRATPIETSPELLEECDES